MSIFHIFAFQLTPVRPGEDMNLEFYILHTINHEPHVRYVSCIPVKPTDWCAQRVLAQAYDCDDMIQRYYKYAGVENFIKDVINGKLSVNFNLISNDSDHFNDTEKALENLLRSAVFE